MPSHPAVPLLLAAILGIAAPPRAQARPPVTWSVESRGLPFSDWRQRLVPGADGEVWLGGTVSPGSPGGLLYHRPPGEDAAWRSVPIPSQAVRTFVLDSDPAGGLRLCAYSASEESTYGGLTLRHYDGENHDGKKRDGGRWREERVVPGIWPQVMDMV